MDLSVIRGCNRAGRAGRRTIADTVIVRPDPQPAAV
jgi:hypothetical protein